MRKFNKKLITTLAVATAITTISSVAAFAGTSVSGSIGNINCRGSLSMSSNSATASTSVSSSCGVRTEVNYKYGWGTGTYVVNNSNSNASTYVSATANSRHYNPQSLGASGNHAAYNNNGSWSDSTSIGEGA